MRVSVLFGALLLAGPSEVAGGVTITKCKMADKTNGGEVTSGMADSDLSVEFRGAAKCTCSGATLTYTWYFGDGTSADGATVSHVYGDSGAGNRSPSLSATCNICKSFTQQGGLTVAAIRGITVTQIGDIMNPTANGRLCFDAHRSVAAVAEPSGVSGSDKIDWYLVVTASALSKANMASGDLGALPQWPTSNSLWGANTLYVSIDGPHVAGQEGEMILTGTPSYVSENKSIEVFYDEAGTQHPGGTTPNWFYYCKQTSANKGTMNYDSGATLGHCYPNTNPDYLAYLGTGCHGAYSTPTVGKNANQSLNGIDTFAWIARHEWKHHESWDSWWGAGGVVPANDTDSDCIPDNLEAGFGADAGGPYNNTKGDTYTTDSLAWDSERHTCFTQDDWTVGSADSVDWAHPGNQWRP